MIPDVLLSWLEEKAVSPRPGGKKQMRLKHNCNSITSNVKHLTDSLEIWTSCLQI